MQNETSYRSFTPCSVNPPPPRMATQTRPPPDVGPHDPRSRIRAASDGHQSDTVTTERPAHVPIMPLIDWLMQSERRMIMFAEAVADAIKHRDDPLVEGPTYPRRSPPITTESNIKPSR